VKEYDQINDPPEVTALKTKLNDKEAIRSEMGVFLDGKDRMRVHSDILRTFVVELNDLVKNNVQDLYQN
jgi:hypothetical protein